MKKIITLILTLVSIPAIANEIYLGFVFGAASRGGLILGYKIDDDHSIEAHLGAVPHVLTYGLSLKAYKSDNPRDYYILGYSNTSWMRQESSSSYHGLNIGYGHEFGDLDDDWSYPVEIGAGPAYSFEDEEFAPLFFVGFGAIYDKNQSQNK